jgi:hypothetical protein
VYTQEKNPASGILAFVVMIAMVAGALIFAALAFGAAPIDPKHAVLNCPGVCWFCCADTIGRQHGIKGLVGLRDKVLAAGGPARDAGASVEAINEWMEKVDVECMPVRASQEWVVKQIDKGRPLIVSRDVGGAYSHAVIPTSCNADTIWYYDPNDGKDHVSTWDDFNFTGLCWMFPR